MKNKNSKKKVQINSTDLHKSTSNLLLALNSIPLFFINIKNLKILYYLSNHEIKDQTFEEVISQAISLDHIVINLVEDQTFENVCLFEIIKDDHRLVYGEIKENNHSTSLFEQDKFIESFKLDNSISNKNLIQLILKKFHKYTDRQFISITYQLILKRPIDWETRDALMNNKDPYPNLFWRTKTLFDLIDSEEYKNLKNSVYDIFDKLIDIK